MVYGVFAGGENREPVEDSPRASQPNVTRFISPCDSGRRNDAIAAPSSMGGFAAVRPLHAVPEIK